MIYSSWTAHLVYVHCTQTPCNPDNGSPVSNYESESFILLANCSSCALCASKQTALLSRSV